MRHVSTVWRAGAFAVLAPTLLSSCLIRALSSSSPTLVAQDIPAGFDFPADENVLLGHVYSENRQAIREHAWNIWAGLTQQSRSTHNGNPLPIWETWYSATEVFEHRYKTSTEPAPRRTFTRHLEIPKQSVHKTSSRNEISAAVMSFVELNQPAAQFIWDNNYYLRSALDDLNARFNENHAPVEQRQIKPLPRTAVALKIVFWLIKNSDSPQSEEGLTALPYWDSNYPPPPDGQTPTHLTWPKCVAVDPAGRYPVGSKQQVTCNGRSGVEAEVVRLNRFYTSRLTTKEDVENARYFMRVLSGAGGEQERFVTNQGQIPELNDYIVLCAMHVTTKEMDNWTFQTFWWSPTPDAPPYGDFRTPNVTGVWRNYQMCTAYSMVTPRTPTGSPHICFNPYLETDLGPTKPYAVGSRSYPPDPMAGTRSNCMNCHMRAAWPAPPPTNPANDGYIPPHYGGLATYVKTDFLWSLVFHSQPQKGK